MHYSSAFNGVSTTIKESTFEKKAIAIPYQKESEFLDQLSYHQLLRKDFFR